MSKIVLFAKKYKVYCALITIGLLISGLTILMLADFGIVKVPGTDYPVYLIGWRSIAFDKVQWREAGIPAGLFGSRGPGRDNRRARMVNDLISHHLHKGMTKTQVEKLLGRPMAGGDGVELYDLIAFPSWDQKVVAWLRWQSPRPILVLRYRGKTCEEKLDNVELSSRG